MLTYNVVMIVMTWSKMVTSRQAHRHAYSETHGQTDVRTGITIWCNDYSSALAVLSGDII